jgi:hypothetical protein
MNPATAIATRARVLAQDFVRCAQAAAIRERARQPFRREWLSWSHFEGPQEILECRSAITHRFTAPETFEISFSCALWRNRFRCPRTDAGLELWRYRIGRIFARCVEQRVRSSSGVTGSAQQHADAR